jgi:hypothetical protein
MRKGTEIRLVDRMISAYEVYASLVRRVGHLARSDGDLAGPLAA